MKEWIINVTWAGWEDDVNSYTYCVKSETKPDEKYIIDFHNTFIADEEDLPEGVINTSAYNYVEIGRMHYDKLDREELVLDDGSYEGAYLVNYSVNELEFYELLGENEY